IAKTDAFGHTLFAWDGNRLLSEQRGSRTTLYLYEPNSFAPLAQLVDGQDQEEKTPHATTAAANDATEDEDWSPRQAKEAFMQRMLSQQRHIQALAQQAAQAQANHGRQRGRARAQNLASTLLPQRPNRHAP
ncbi:hypothetical protein, partial [Lampropedia aestuarii]|uniref:hypothetical protein n=1 Tax=Lampropedia aestuarii TaxID=2562762 RepID=UPI001F1055A7